MNIKPGTYAAIADRAGKDPRSVRDFLEGKEQRPSTQRAIYAAMIEMTKETLLELQALEQRRDARRGPRPVSLCSVPKVMA